MGSACSTDVAESTKIDTIKEQEGQEEVQLDGAATVPGPTDLRDGVDKTTDGKRMAVTFAEDVEQQATHSSGFGVDRNGENHYDKASEQSAGLKFEKAAMEAEESFGDEGSEYDQSVPDVMSDILPDRRLLILPPQFKSARGPLPTPMPALEPLHVRGLRAAEMRKTEEEITHHNELVWKLRHASDRGEHKEWGKTKIELEEELYRTECFYNMLVDRLDRFEGLGETYKELPEQVMAAAKQGDVGYIKFALDAKLPPDMQDRIGTTPLMMAVIRNKISAVKLLLEHNADLGIQDVNGATCIHYAVFLNHLHVLDACLDVGNYRCLVVKDLRGLSAIDYARRADRSGCMALVRQRMGGPVPVACTVCQAWTKEALGNCCAPAQQ